MSDEIKNRLICAARQFRHNSDNSPDIFNPKEGFVVAYDKDEIDDLVSGLQSEVERLRERLADAEANWPKGKYIPGRVTEVVNPTEPYILRKQAEAVEAAAKECMPGPCGPPDDPPAGYQEYCEGVASVRDYAERLRQQAAESESQQEENDD